MRKEDVIDLPNAIPPGPDLSFLSALPLMMTCL